MNRRNYHRETDELNDVNYFIFLWYLRFLLLQQKISQLRPVQIVFPVVVAQAVLFVTAAHLDHFFMIVAVGNLVIVGIALIPMTMRRPPQKRTGLPPPQQRDADEQTILSNIRDKSSWQ